MKVYIMNRRFVNFHSLKRDTRIGGQQMTTDPRCTYISLLQSKSYKTKVNLVWFNGIPLNE